MTKFLIDYRYFPYTKYVGQTTMVIDAKDITSAIKKMAKKYWIRPVDIRKVERVI